MMMITTIVISFNSVIFMLNNYIAKRYCITLSLVKLFFVFFSTL